MKKIVHILTSRGPGNDQFCEMTFLSVALAKRLYPDTESVVLCDRESAEFASQLPLEFDGFQIEEIPKAYAEKTLASRYLKTRMRQLVDGDLVFLDADALALNEFDQVFTHGQAFAAALDRNRQSPEPAFPDWVVPHYESMAWSQPLERYFNSGVMFMADRAEMYELSVEWHRNWNELLEKTGVHQDQPSFNHTLDALDIPAEVLPIECNAMVDASPYFSRGAKIVHYFLRGEDRSPDPVSLLNHLIRHLRDCGEIDWEAVDQAAKRSDAWVHPTRSVHIELASRNYLRAFGIAATRAIRKS